MRARPTRILGTEGLQGKRNDGWPRGKFQGAL